MKKRALSLLLALVLALSLTPAAAAYDGQASQIDRVPVQQNAAPRESSSVAAGLEEQIPYTGRSSALKEQHLYGAVIDENQVYQTLISLRDVYPEKAYWTNENTEYTLGVTVYDEKDGFFYMMTGSGCAAFCYMLSDAAFDTPIARMVYNFTYDDVRVGDILRLNDGTPRQHSVTVLEKHEAYVVLAEANYNSSVHWGRMMTRAEVMEANYITTRYPVSGSVSGSKPSNVSVSTNKSSYAPGENVSVLCSAENAISYSFNIWRDDYDGVGMRVTSLEELYNRSSKIRNYTAKTEGSYTLYVVAANNYGTTTAACQFTVSNSRFIDVNPSDYYFQAVEWAAENGITYGTGGSCFSPNSTVTRGEALTFLWRAMGEPSPSVTDSRFADVSACEYYSQAVLWAVENGITEGVSATEFNPGGTVTRGEMITFLWRTQGKPGETGQGEWYADAEAWARSNSLLNATAAAYATGAGCPRSDAVYYMWNALT